MRAMLIQGCGHGRCPALIAVPVAWRCVRVDACRHHTEGFSTVNSSLVATSLYALLTADLYLVIPQVLQAPQQLPPAQIAFANASQVSLEGVKGMPVTERENACVGRESMPAFMPSCLWELGMAFVKLPWWLGL